MCKRSKLVYGVRNSYSTQELFSLTKHHSSAATARHGGRDAGGIVLDLIVPGVTSRLLRVTCVSGVYRTLGVWRGLVGYAEVVMVDVEELDDVGKLCLRQ